MYALINCRVFTGSDVLNNHAVIIDGVNIHAIIPESDVKKDIETIDLQGANLTLALLTYNSMAVVA